MMLLLDVSRGHQISWFSLPSGHVLLSSAAWPCNFLWPLRWKEKGYVSFLGQSVEDQGPVILGARFPAMAIWKLKCRWWHDKAVAPLSGQVSVMTMIKSAPANLWRAGSVNKQ